MLTGAATPSFAADTDRPTAGAPAACAGIATAVSELSPMRASSLETASGALWA